VWLAPLAAYTLLGLPVDELGGQTIDLVDVIGPAGRRLGEQLREASSWRLRFTLLDELLLKRLERGPSPAPEVRRAWYGLVAAGGTEPTGRLADEVGWSHKHLITKFRQQIGVTPKTTAGIVRFESLRHRLSLDRRRPPDWAQLAADAGYADQPHLIREFRRHVGMTPTEFLVRASGHPRDDVVKSVQEARAVNS
jgi:AraC-like DNA-binding protein